MNYKVIVSDRAAEMLSRHISFISKVSKKAARKTKNEIVEAIKKLKRDALVYPFFEQEFIPKNKYHKCVINKRYLLLYQVKDNVVFVEYIVDTREDYYWLL
ncbi:MAG: type II toxin-antitoxin system RelE/ParE family toxin [Solobacterium sp.]|nr:type II toxin-antitoxin system RelE/ParE family toxin [Solobacterium sp.]